MLNMPLGLIGGVAGVFAGGGVLLSRMIDSLRLRDRGAQWNPAVAR
jgi:hypothetical protein